MSAENEKRKYPRADLVFKMAYAPEAGAALEATTGRDLSVGGVSFATSEKLDAETVLKITFTIDGLPGEINAHGRVVRSWEKDDTAYAAVEFTEIHKGDHIIIQDFIETYIKEVLGGE